MTREEARTYVRQWARAGRALEAQRWHELSTLTPDRARAASDALIAAALTVPVPAARRTWSGLVAQQRAFHRQRT
jgi:hypothetical protein